MERSLLPKLKHLSLIVCDLRSRHGLRVEVLDAPGGQSLRFGMVVVPVYGAHPYSEYIWNFRSPSSPTHMHGYANGTREVFVAQLADVLRGRRIACCDFLVS